MTKKKYSVYIAGAMRGHEDGQTPLFNDTANSLREAGYEVFNPAENEDGLTLSQYMLIDLEYVIRADAVCVVGLWDNSEGARVEVQLARMLGKPVLELNALLSENFGLHAPIPIELEAAGLVRNGARQKTYSHPRFDFKRTGGMWSAYLGHEVTEQDVAIMMALLKASRLKATPGHRDSLVDMAGYLLCYARLDEPQ